MVWGIDMSVQARITVILVLSLGVLFVNIGRALIVLSLANTCSAVPVLQH